MIDSPSGLIVGALLCVVAGAFARWLQAESDSRVGPWVKYAVAVVVVVSFLSRAVLRDTEESVVLGIALMVAGAIGLHNAPTRRQRRIKEAIEPRLAAIRAVLESEAGPILDESDRQDALLRTAQRAFSKRDLSGFQAAISDISNLDRRRDTAADGHRSLLIEAAADGATEFVEDLLAHGAAVNQADTYRGAYTPLQLAAQRGHLSTVRLLIQNGADVNARDQWGKTALWYAAVCHGGHVDVVNLLLRAGADPALADTEGRTPLDWATMNKPKQQNAAVVAALRAVTKSR